MDSTAECSDVCSDEKTLVNRDHSSTPETCVPTNGVTDRSSAQYSRESSGDEAKHFESCPLIETDTFKGSFESDFAGLEAQSDSGHFDIGNASMQRTVRSHNHSSAFLDPKDGQNNDEDAIDDALEDEDDCLESNAAGKMELHKCYLCSSKLTNAHVLTCLHRFCYKCIVDKAFSDPLLEGLKTNFNEQVKCPLCSQFTPTSCLVKDLVSVNSYESFDGCVGESSNGDSEIRVCTACKSGERSIGKCYTCDSQLCESCVSAHQTMRCFETHSLTMFANVVEAADRKTSPKCSKHNDETIQFYCNTCQALCCNICLQTYHTNTSELNGSPTQHIHYKISEKLIRKMSEHLKCQIVESRMNQKTFEETVSELKLEDDDLSFNKEEVKQAIDEHYHSLKDKIDKCHQELLTHLNYLHHERRLEIWKSINQCEKLSNKFEDALTFAQLFVDKHFEQSPEYFVDFLKLKDVISRRLCLLSNYSLPEVRRRRCLPGGRAVGNDHNEFSITFSPVEIESLFPSKIFGSLSVPQCSSPSNSSNDMLPTVSRYDGRLNLDLSPDLLSPTLSSSGLDTTLVEPLTHCINSSSARYTHDESLVSSCPNIPPMTLSKSKIARQASLIVNTPDPLLPVNAFGGQSIASHSLSARTTPEPSLLQSQTHSLASQFASGMNLRSLTNSSSAFSAPLSMPTSTSTATANNASQQLDLSDIYTRINLAQLAMCDNVGSQQGLSAVHKAVSSTPSPQPTGVPLDNPGFILSDTAINNINELAKFTTQQQNGLSSIAGSLTTPTPPSSSANTPPLTLAPRSGSKVSVMQIRCKFGQLGSQRGQFSSPHGFCLGVEEEIVIADTNNHRICIFDKNGEFKHMFGATGKDEGQLWYPRKVAIIRLNTNGSATGSPRYVICDRGSERSRMQIFTRNGHFIRKIAIRYIDIVAGLAITPAGHIVAVDSVSPTVFVIAESGDLLRWFDCSEHMREPSDIAVNGQEYYICDFKGHCVVVFDEEGRYMRRIGGEKITNFPNGIDISDAGDVLVGDSHGNRFHVVVFDKNGAILSEFECPYVKVSRCCGLKITSEGYVVTLAKNNHHVLILNTLYIM